MTDESDSKKRDHWAELADQLGLPPVSSDREPSAPASAAHIPASASSALPAAEADPKIEMPRKPAVPASSEEDWRRGDSAPAEAGDRHVFGGELQPSSEAKDDLEQGMPYEFQAEGEPAHGAGAKAGGDEDDDRSNRRRGRRSGSGRSSRSADTGETAPPSARDDSSENDEKGDQARQRGRGRGRPERARPAVTVDSSPTQDDEDSDSSTSDHLVDEEMDTLSDWNVPSWNELIASLHRPER